MNICFFLNHLEEKKYSKNLNAYNIIQSLYDFYGIKDKKYNKQILKNEEFNLFLYSSKTSFLNLKAIFNNIKIMCIIKPYFLKKFLHNFIGFSHLINSKNFVYCFDLPLPNLFFKNQIILELSSLAPFINQDFFSKKHNLNEILSSINRADHIIVHTQEMKEALIYKLFSNKDKIKVLDKAINNCFFSTQNNTELLNIKKQYNLKNDYIIFTGKLSKYKNIERLCSSFLELKLPNIDLLIAGSFNQDYDTYKNNIHYYNAINKLAKENKNIKLISYIKQNELAVLLKEAKLLVEPSFYNDFPDTIIEAYASNTEVIASNISVHRNLLNNKDFLFSPYSKEELKNAIIYALKNTNFNKIKNIDKFKTENVIKAYKDYLYSLKQL